ncbi:MAG: nuclease-related domain-containing protein [Isosphaeraceae bacterium]
MTGDRQKSPGLVDRLRVWSEIRKARSVAEDAGVTGGREAEDLLTRLVGASYSFQDARLLTGRRIPSRRQGRRREIDLIICTPRTIHLVEVKNWSGRLTTRDGSWRQTRRSGEVVDHGNLLRENALRRDAVLEYLNERGVAVDDRFAREYLVPEVMFMNPRLELDPEVEARPDVYSRRELDEFLGKRPQGEASDRLFASLIDYFLATESRRGGGGPGPIPASTYQSIVACLASAGTWDRLRLHGTKVVTGDVLSLTVGGQTYRQEELSERSAGMPIRVRWVRNPWLGLFLALTGLRPLGRLGLGSSWRDLSPEDTVLFHAVGDPGPRPVRLIDVDGIET